MNSSEKYYKEIISRFPPADQAILKSIIDKLTSGTSNNDNLFDLVLELLEEIFREITSHGLGMSLDNLSSEDRGILEHELNKILETLNENSNGQLTKEEMVRLLVKSLQRKFLKDIHKRKSKDDTNNVPEHIRKNLKQILYRAFVYEFFKFVNPHQIAGETAQENFINNVVYGGLKYALDYAGKEFAHDTHTMSQVGKIVKDINKGNFNSGRQI